MSTFKELTQDYNRIAIIFFLFKSQTDVRYVIRDSSISPGINIHLTKDDLIACIKYFLYRLNRFSFADRIKQGFNLDNFKYYDLSVYLHGILQLYASNLGLPPVNELRLTRFSHLPHDILKANKQTLNIEVAQVKDPEGPICYTCVVGYIPFCSRSIEGLKLKLRLFFPHWKSKYNIVLDVK